jgi:predicted permease
MSWLKRLLGRAQLERELDAELRHHLDEEARRLEAEGLSREEARRRALAAFGGLDPIKEQTRDARGTRWLDDLGRDTRYALRLMRRSPVFTLAAVGSLAIGIGANTAIFSIIDALLLRALPVAAPAELYFLEKGTGQNEPNRRFSYPLLLEFQRSATMARFAAASAPASMQVSADGSPELTAGQLVSGDWFDVLGLQPQVGRLISAADDTGEGRPVVVLSDAYWTRRFGRDRSVIGKTLRVNGAAVTVAGVAPPKFDGLIVGSPMRLWAPTALQHALRSYSNASSNNADTRQPWIGQDGVQWLTVVARLPDPAARGAVEASLAGPLRQSIKTVFGDAPSDILERRLRERVWLVPGALGLSPMRDSFSGALRVLMATVALVLLVACANLASLLLARNTARTRELTLRLAIGARRGRLVRQLLTESLMLALLGGAAGLAFARWAAPILPRLALSAPPTSMPLDLPLDGRLLGFSLGVSVLTGLLFGLAPAWRWSRADLQDALRSSGRVMGGSHRFSRGLVVVQVAVALVLLVGALLFVKTLRNYLSLDAGFDREHVITARIDPRLAAIDEARLPALSDRLLEEARRIPGVRAATLATQGHATGSQRISGISAQGYEAKPGEETSVQEDYVGPTYFTTVAIPLRRGRDFTDRDAMGAPEVAIINEAMARRYFPGKDPVGQRFGYSSDRLQFEVVGVAADALINGLRDAVPAMAYYPLRQNPRESVRNVYVRGSGPPEATRAALRAAIKAADPNLAVREVVTLEELASRSVARERLISSLVGAFGILAVVVACLGLYGTMSYAVERRTNEIGVRLALGASPALVRWLVLRESCGLVALGCAAGLIAVLPLQRFVQTLLFGLSPRDPITLAGATAALVVVSLLASLAPAWRASRVDPLQALRSE